MVIKKIIKKTEKAKLAALEKARKIKQEFRKQTITAVIAAFAFLIALSWRDAIKDSIDKLIESLGIIEHIYFYKFLSAILVTIIAIIGIMIVSKFKVQEEQKDKEN